MNHGDTWTFTERDSGRVRTMRFTDAKSKEDLKSRLEWAARWLKLERVRIPGVEPAVFLSDRGLRAELARAASRTV